MAQTNPVDTLIFINPKSTYLKLSNDSGALNAVGINLNDLGLIDLDHIVLQQKGDYDNGPNGDTYIGMSGVFSVNDSLLESTQQNRVPGAINAGEDFSTHNTYYSNLVTDIPEDFYIDSIVIQIPDSAEYLFISPHDSWFNDNSDPDNDYGVRIVKTEIKSIDTFSGYSSPVFELIQNYPNPFNPSTTIKFTLLKSEFTTLKVYNILGKEIATLVSNKLNQGIHTHAFDGKNLANGLYYYQLVAGDYRKVKKMILLK